MSSTVNRYLDIDSTYRNRKIWKLSSDFEIPVTFGAKSNNVFNSSDPVFLAYPFDDSINGTANPIGVLTDTFILDASFSSVDNTYSNCYFEIDSLSLNPTYVKIISYIGSTKTLITENNVTIPIGALVSIRKELPQIRAQLGAGSTQIDIQLPSTLSNVNDFYKGFLIRFVTQNGAASLNYGIVRSYNGTTKIATLISPLPLPLCIAGDIFELLNFSYDNYNPLLYSGTTIMTQPVCYAIELLYLTLPNKKIKNGNRNGLDSYPYFYVKLYNVNKNSSNHLLISNNPNSEFVSFKIPMTLVLKQETFFTLRDSKCVQVYKFQPEQSIHFTVTLPNGEPIEFLDNDYFSPNPPDPFLQISASFSMRRIDGN